MWFLGVLMHLKTNSAPLETGIVLSFAINVHMKLKFFYLREQLIFSGSGGFVARQPFFPDSLSVNTSLQYKVNRLRLSCT